MTTRLTIDQMIAELIRKEGDYSNHPSDKGGPTRFGVTEEVARRAGYQGDMRNFPRGLAEQIYRDRYFVKPGLDRVHLLSVAIAEEMFDTGVNMGPEVPCLWLQRMLNVMAEGPGMVVDGKVGPVTIMALRAYLNRRGPDGERVMVRALNCLQGARYIELAETRPRNKDFIYGWLLNRVGV